MRSGKLDLDGTDPDLAAELLSNFWNRQHFAGSTVHRPAFTRDMATGPAGPYFSPLLLNAMLFAGSKHSDHRGARDDGTNADSIGRPFRRRFDALLRGDPGVLFASRITTVQALLIVADALFSWCDERSLSWHYTGLAIGMIVDLGLHTESGWSGLSPLDVEVRRRVFWAAFGEAPPPPCPLGSYMVYVRKLTRWDQRWTRCRPYTRAVRPGCARRKTTCRSSSWTSTRNWSRSTRARTRRARASWTCRRTASRRLSSWPG